MTYQDWYFEESIVFNFCEPRLIGLFTGCLMLFDYFVLHCVSQLESQWDGVMAESSQTNATQWKSPKWLSSYKGRAERLFPYSFFLGSRNSFVNIPINKFYALKIFYWARHRIWLIIFDERTIKMLVTEQFYILRPLCQIPVCRMLHMFQTAGCSIKAL